MIAAVEDVLTEAVLRRMLRELRPDLAISVFLGKTGRGYIEKRAIELNRTARSIPVIILMDLDRPKPCPADLIAKVLSSQPAPNLLFRIAVMEIESWVMADRDRFARFLGVPSHRIPLNTDTISAPKEFVVSLARRSSRRDVREDLVPAAGGTAVVGPAFNPRLVTFVTNEWSLRRAAECSPSLRKMVQRLATAFF